MKKILAVMILAILLLFGGIAVWDGVKMFFIKQYFSTFKPPALLVETALSKRQRWQPSLSAIGTLHAKHHVMITAEIPGKVVNVHFQQGQLVKKGTLLVQQDDRTDQADLEAHKAAAGVASLNYQRYKKLLKTNATSRFNVDQYFNQKKQALAMLKKTQIIIDRKAIKAPFTGYVGLHTIAVGQYLVPGEKIVDLYSASPLEVHFSLPEQRYRQLKVGQIFQVRLKEKGKVVAKGKIQSVGVAADRDTHQLRLKGVLDGKQDKRLLPGQFVYITLDFGQARSVIVIPKTAVTYRTYGNTVYVVKGKDEKHVQQKAVTVGEIMGDNVIILKGIALHERVVTSGQLRLYQGARVKLTSKSS